MERSTREFSQQAEDRQRFSTVLSAHRAGTGPSDPPRWSGLRPPALGLPSHCGVGSMGHFLHKPSREGWI